MITDGAEVERLDRSLQRIWGRGFRVVTDPTATVPPDEQLRHVQPDVLLVGMGQLGVDVRAYVTAARQHAPACAVCLLCDRQHGAQARHLGPDRVLFRPVSVAEVQACLAELGKNAREREDARSHRFSSTARATGPLPQAAPSPPDPLWRADELFADPLLLGWRLPELAPVLTLPSEREASPLHEVELELPADLLPLVRARAG
jgi:hypothetical protein